MSLKWGRGERNPETDLTIENKIVVIREEVNREMHEIGEGD